MNFITYFSIPLAASCEPNKGETSSFANYKKDIDLNEKKKKMIILFITGNDVLTLRKKNTSNSSEFTGEKRLCYGTFQSIERKTNRLIWSFHIQQFFFLVFIHLKVQLWFSTITRFGFRLCYDLTGRTMVKKRNNRFRFSWCNNNGIWGREEKKNHWIFIVCRR